MAPYGEVAWVRNARAAGEVTLSRVRRSETVALVELGPEEAAPLLKQSVTAIAITRPLDTIKVYGVPFLSLISGLACRLHGKGLYSLP